MGTEDVPQCPLALPVRCAIQPYCSTGEMVFLTTPYVVVILNIFPQVYGLVGINKMLTSDRNLSILRRLSRYSSWL